MSTFTIDWLTNRSWKGMLVFSLFLLMVQSSALAVPLSKKPKPIKEVFSMKNVVNKARELASKPFQNPAGQLADFLLRITYDQWRDIRFKAENSLWRNEGLPFELQFFHPGLYYDRSVKVNVIGPSKVEVFPFSPELFDYGANDFKSKVPIDTGFAGLRVHYDINNKKNYKDEVIVFVGASYFRAVAVNMGYGMSARGLAIDTAEPSGEEFPFFKEFWLKKPGPNDTQLTVYALLDSPCATGAYCYVIHPGKETVAEVESTVFLRKPVAKLGIAPLTSMFYYGENTNARPIDDFRPEIHDSDGLQLALRSGEWLWRPLVNPSDLRVHAFQSDNPAGFGLVQRDQDFDHYQDLETRYELRPSVWISPKGEWGKGSVELIQIPSEIEIHDNIVAFWKPEACPLPLQPVSYAYTMSWHFPAQTRPPGGRVVATRTSKGKGQDMRKFIVDFEGGELEMLKDDEVVEGMITVGQGFKLVEQQVFRNRVTGGWRLVFQIQPERNETLVERVMPDKKPILELRAFLRRGYSILTETWSYGVRF